MVVIRIPSPGLSPCSETGRPRMTLLTMDTLTPSALVLCVGDEKVLFSLPDLLPGIFQTNEHSNKTQDHLPKGWTS